MENLIRPITRRRFLAYSAASLALQACALAGRKIKPQLSSVAEERQFYVPSPRYYLNLDQDFSGITYSKIVASPSKHIPEKFRTHVTVIGSSSRQRRTLSLPGLVHSTLPARNQAFMIPTDGQKWIYSIDAKSLEIVSFRELSENAFPFGGHAVVIPDSEHIAVTTNSRQIGIYDRVSILEKNSLKEVGNVSSFGFEAHDLKITPDGKHLYIGHYGSLLGSGPYDAFSHKDLKGLAQKTKAYGVNNLTNIYPPSITVVELSSGKLLDRFCSTDSGAHCHFALGAERRLYLPHRPSLLKNRADTMTNPLFLEGVHGAEHMAEFTPKMRAGFGTSIAYDPESREVIIPSRWTETLNIFSEDSPENFRSVDLKPLLPQMEKTHGFAFHPDNWHYIITGNNWLATLERKTHRVNQELSFSAPFFVHAHTAVG